MKRRPVIWARNGRIFISGSSANKVIDLCECGHACEIDIRRCCVCLSDDLSYRCGICARRTWGSGGHNGKP